MLEVIELVLLILLCVGWVIKMGMDGAEPMDLMGLLFGSVAIGWIAARMFV